MVIEEFRQRYPQPALRRPEHAVARPGLRAPPLPLGHHRHRTGAHRAGHALRDVQAFYRRHYRPGNAILSIVADLDEERMLRMAEERFGSVPRATRRRRSPCP